jgi:hypothetical protein
MAQVNFDLKRVILAFLLVATSIASGQYSFLATNVHRIKLLEETSALGQKTSKLVYYNSYDGLITTLKCSTNSNK